jgi:hypothetical protein
MEGECSKIGMNHDMNHCPCNPNWERQGYCQVCLRKLIPFTAVDKPDWPTREYHRACYQRAVAAGEYRCEECGEWCNDFKQEFCECQA